VHRDERGDVALVGVEENTSRRPSRAQDLGLRDAARSRDVGEPGPVRPDRAGVPNLARATLVDDPVTGRGPIRLAVIGAPREAADLGAVGVRAVHRAVPLRVVLRDLEDDAPASGAKLGSIASRPESRRKSRPSGAAEYV